MNRKEKRELYEFIMRDISDIVMEELNEYGYGRHMYDDYLNYMLTESVLKDKIIPTINRGVKKGILAATIGASVTGGMQSCSTPFHNGMTNPNQTTVVTPHDDLPDYSNRPWAYEPFIGTKQTCKTLIGTLDRDDNPYTIKKLIVTQPDDSLYTDEDSELYKFNLDDGAIGSWTTCNWTIFYVQTEKCDDYKVEIYRSYGLPLDDTSYDGSFYVEIWFLADNLTDREENAQFMRVYRTPEQKRETTWQIDISQVKNSDENHYNLHMMGQIGY